FRDLRSELVAEDDVLELLIAEVAVVDVGRVAADESWPERPHLLEVVRLVLLRVTRARDGDAHAQLAIERHERFLRERAKREIDTDVIELDALDGVEGVAEVFSETVSRKGFAPAQDLGVVKLRHQERHEETLAHLGEFLRDLEVPEH